MDRITDASERPPDGKVRQGTTRKASSLAMMFLLAILGVLTFVVASNMMNSASTSALTKGGPTMISGRSLSGSARAKIPLDPGLAQRMETATFALG